MNRTLTEQTITHQGQSVMVQGWVNAIRNHGKVLFIDIRDRTGLLQAVTGPWNPEVFEIASRLHAEDVVEVTGTIADRPEKLINPLLKTGAVEMQIESITVLNAATVLPFQIDSTTINVDEELRMKYRYLDLRTERMAKNIKQRAALVRFCRAFLDARGFTEIETPLLTASTPEGARDYVVPSRLNAGSFYALPQSPQQYKQLLMVAGVERYYQIAKCLRDEDSRGDRQPEFTQLDMELSFTSQEEIMQLNEELFTSLIKVLYPEKTITQSPWPRLTYAESMQQYGSDKPDLRKDKSNPNELAFVWIINFPLFEYNEREKRIEPMHHMFTMPLQSDVELLDTDPLKVIGQLYDMVCNGYETASGSIRIVDQDIQSKVFSLIGLSPGQAHTKFGHMLEAFTYGAPPHGGIAPGLDRLLMLLQNEPNIREVIAFPKTGEGRDPLMGAPSTISELQLKDLHITVGK